MSTPDPVVAIQDGFWRAAEALLFRHTNPWELDEALCAWGYAMGPCEAQDLVGLDRVLSRGGKRAIPILPRMVAEGRMGKGGGVGYYRYPGGGGAVIDPLIEDLILEEAWFAKVARSDISDETIVAQLNATLGNMCQSLLARGMRPDALGDLLNKAVHFPKGRALPTVD